MSTYHNMSPMPTEDYVIDAGTVAVEPVRTVSAPESKTVKRSRGPEFYKPFHYILLAYLFAYCSRIPELIPFLHIGMLLQPILLIGMIMTGTTKAILRNSVGRIMIAFTGWVAICVPFSVWKGGSFTIFVTMLQALALLFFMASFVKTIADCFRVMYTIALAMAAVGVLSVIIGGGRLHDTRLGLGTGGDTLSDANFLALYLVVGLPFLWFSISLKKGPMKIALCLMMIPMLAGMARTGSRMGLLALAAGLLLFFIFASAKEKAAIIMGGSLFLVLALVLLPERIVQRFTTFFNPTSAAGLEAAQSTNSRKVLLKRSLDLSLEHPLLGVGPGQFMVAEAEEAEAVGRRGVWHYTHNSYTELSSETGVMGLFLFVFALYKCYKGMTPVRNGFPNPRVRRAALFLQVAVLMTAIGAFFLSIAYSGIVYVIMGLSAAFQVAVRDEMRLRKAQAREALP